MSREGADWLSEATARIGSSLDLTRTAREVIDVAVPEIADAAAVFMPERLLAGEDAWHRNGHTAMRRLAAGVDGQPEAVIDGLLPPCEVVAVTEDSPAFRAMAGRRPIVYDRPDSKLGERLAHHPATRGLTSFLATPLIARGTVLGCAAFGRTDSGPRFEPADITQLAELASRAALSIDNARLYDRQRQAAAALQRGLLPGRPRVPPGLEVAHCYLPVGDSVVGGDWYEIVPLPGGRAALIIGDAMGHGPEAAAVMVQLRTAARTLADLDLPPTDVLRRLDKMAAEMTCSPYATCVYAILDPSDGSCTIAQAGHLPPLLVLPGGATRVLDLPPGLPLAIGAEDGAGAYEATRIALPRGATLAFYTDGLVENRVQPLDDGMAALQGALGSALTRPGATLDGTCGTVAQTLQDHDEDDITLVLARIRGADQG
jgi:serine phosphatase RsbU (regulator of sigma subunit)